MCELVGLEPAECWKKMNICFESHPNGSAENRAASARDVARSPGVHQWILMA